MNVSKIACVWALAVCGFAAVIAPSHAGTSVYLGPRIDPPKVAFTFGRVIGERSIPAYAPAIGGTIDANGSVSCMPSGPIERSTVFRIEANGQYYDFLKSCSELGFTTNWSNWEHLHIGEAISFRIQNRDVSLTIPRCERLGLIKPPSGGLQALLTMDAENFPQCSYKVTMARIGSPDSKWVFRVIGAGSIADAKTTEIGAAYGPSLAPPF